MSSLSIGLSGLLVSQRLIDLSGENITNANTPDYHRQVGDLAARVAGGSVGMGVEVQSISRVIDTALEKAAVTNSSAESGASAQLDGLNQLQSFLAPGDGSLQDALAKFFDSAEQLSAQPGDLTLRQSFLSAASSLTDQLNAATNNMAQLRNGLVTQATSAATSVNQLTMQIAQFNQQIHDILAAGGTANELQDQRDHAVGQLAQLIDVRTVPQPFGEVNILAGGVPLVLNSSAVPISAGVNGQNQLAITTVGSPQPLEITGGSLGGLLTLTNTTFPQVGAQLDTLAQGLVTRIDEIHASSVGLDGPLTSLTSQRAASATNVPLAAAHLAYPPQAGNLYVTVTNLATGQRTLSKIAVDPATQSLANIASNLSTIPNLQAVADPQAGTLNIVARPGFGFDFTGNFSTAPDAQALTGTATPTFTGAYTGAGNDTLNFKVVGSGNVGSTPGLSLEVRNGAGTLLTTLNVGPGYEPGAGSLNVLGVNVNLSAGTLNNGDTFSLNVASKPDSGNVLTALGLNTLFVGSGAGGLSVNPDLLAHPEDLALGKTGQPGDGTALAQLVALRDQPTVNGGTESFQQYLDDILGGIGNQAQDTQSRKDAFDALGQQLDSQRQTVSGVDPNEELIKLMQFQRSYQFSAHFISVVNIAMDEVLKLVGA